MKIMKGSSSTKTSAFPSIIVTGVCKDTWLGRGGEKWGTGRSLSWQTQHSSVVGKNPSHRGVMCWNTNTERVTGWTARSGKICKSSSGPTVPAQNAAATAINSYRSPQLHCTTYFYSSFSTTLLRAPRYPSVRFLFLNHLTSAANWSQYRLIGLRRRDFFHHGKASADHIVFNQTTLII